MPHMNGYEVCSRLREKYPSSLLPIVMVSAKSKEEDVVQALRCGADDYLVKVRGVFDLMYVSWGLRLRPSSIIISMHLSTYSVAY